MPVPTEPEIDPLQDQEEELQGQMSFFDHLEELRTRLLNILIVVAIALVVSWYYVDELFVVMRAPIDLINVPIHILKPTDNFNLPFQLALVAAIFIASPFIMREIWLFISPALYRKERRYAFPFVISSAVLFLLGGTFGYFVAFPLAIAFLVNFGNRLGLQQTMNAMEYFELFLMFEVVMGVVFEIPAVIFILARIGLVSGPFLLRNFRYAVLIASILAAVLTPTTDIPNMMMVGIPMILLYTIGIGVAYIFGKKRREESD
ncbi:MAG TPA: twin-arginine translocase subunit TatC [Terriglobia bacterium]|nr:twin-arginine translocase subunit TatC [Terriglobia bacterium]